eukprot:scaffold19260_cov32-Tisochrysis_lutea.AAC.3
MAVRWGRAAEWSRAVWASRVPAGRAGAAERRRLAGVAGRGARSGQRRSWQRLRRHRRAARPLHPSVALLPPPQSHAHGLLESQRRAPLARSFR